MFFLFAKLGVNLLMVNVINLVQNMLTQYASLLVKERFNGSYQLLCCIDRQGYYRYICPNHKELLGYEIRELTGTNGFEILHPEDKRSLEERLQEQALNKQPVGATHRLRHKDGRWISVSSILTPYLSNGEVVAWVNFSKLRDS
jgi:PAS domain S-box-containing protein